MRFRSIKKFSKSPATEGLIFFAQLMEELLFKYTIDTYKPSAMNIGSLCYEAIELADDIENEIIHPSNLNHVLEELVGGLAKDEVAISLCEIDIDAYISKLKQDNLPLQEIRIVLELLYAQVSRSKYLKRCEELLLDAVRNGKEKNRIRHLTRNYVTALHNIDYSNQYIYACVRSYFHRGGPETINNSSDLQGFFNLLKNKNSSYSVIVKADRMFAEMSSVSDTFSIDVMEELEGDLLSHADQKSMTLSEDTVFLVRTKIHAKDIYAARDRTEDNLEFMSSLICMYHHKTIPKWDNAMIIINTTTNKSRLINSSPNVMLACKDCSTAVAAERLESFVNDFEMRDSNSFQRYFNASKLHSLALKHPSKENQLLNLWMALETLAPSTTAKNKAKINNVIDSILPFLSLSYIPMLTDRLLIDFVYWNKKGFYQILDTIEGDDNRYKLLSLLLLEENKVKRTELYVLLADFHLLRNRAHYFSEILSSTSKINRLLKSHESRVAQQIRRIYRTRNLIVHAGRVPSYIDVLIKNTHDYLDVVTNGISKLASGGGNVSSIDQAFKYAEMTRDNYLKMLSDEDVTVIKSNMEKYIL